MNPKEIRIVIIASVLIVASAAAAGLIVRYVQENKVQQTVTQPAVMQVDDTAPAVYPYGRIDLDQKTEKPAIYLYPQQQQDTKVILDFKGNIVADFPAYNPDIKGWDVTAYPDGHIINKADDQEYSYLYWEGMTSAPIGGDFSKGFVVKGADTRDFLQKTLPKLGLTPKEYNEFIVYWYPQMKDNKYNLIHFAGKEYTDVAALTITPKPDSELRVFMVYKALDKEIAVEPQEIKPFIRTGFSVVEWGGTEVK